MSEIIKGKITITFKKDELVPEITFQGDVDMLAMVTLPYQLSGAYSQHLDKLGDELRHKLSQKGIKTDKDLEQPKMVEEVKENATKES
jgi:hypothetical protein